MTESIHPWAVFVIASHLYLPRPGTYFDDSSRMMLPLLAITYAVG